MAVIDEAHGLDITMVGVHLALRGVPKILMTADPALESLAQELNAPCFAQAEGPPPNLTWRSESRPQAPRESHAKVVGVAIDHLDNRRCFRFTGVRFGVQDFGAGSLAVTLRFGAR